jgi:HK97 family phage major capsid protein
MGSGAGPIADSTAGMPVYTTTQLTRGTAILGNWSELIVGEWAGMRFEASNVAGTAFQNDQTWIKATMLVDFAVRHPESFCLATALTV